MKLKIILLSQFLLIQSLTTNYFLMKANSTKQEKIRTLNGVVVASQNQLDVYTNLSGKRYQEKEALQVDYKLLQRTNNSLIAKVEEQRKELKIKPKEVAGAIVEVTKIDTVFKTVVKDSCYTYTDRWNNLVFCKDWSYVTVEDTTSSIIYIKRIIPNPSKVFFIRWFQKKDNVYRLNVTHANPLIQTTDLKPIIKFE